MGPAWEQISGADRGDGAGESRDSGNLIGSLGTKAATGFQLSRTYSCVCVEYWGGDGREWGTGSYTVVTAQLHIPVSYPHTVKKCRIWPHRVFILE